MPLRLAFMGSPDFAVPTLSALIDAGHDVVRVYAQPPRPAGRGHKERPCPVHAHAADRGIEVSTPKSLKSPETIADFAALGLDAAVVVAYGLILPQAVLDAPRLGCLNVHASLLPRWRGAAPIHRALLAGDAESGISIMQMDAGLDTGGVLAEARTPIAADETAETLHDRLAGMGAALLVETLGKLAAGEATATPQPVEGVTYAEKLDRSEARIDWTLPAADLERRVRALNPWPGVWFEHQGERIKVLKAAAAPGAGKPGTVLNDALAVAAGTGAVRLLELQRPGRSAQPADAFLRGFPIPAGTAL